MKIILWFLVLVPAAIAAHLFQAPATLVFVLAAAALIPLSGLLGKATEELAAHFGEDIGGLLNATFGNLAELIIVIVALKANQVDLVKATLIGSVLGNLLLVLGTSLLVAGLRHHNIRFNREIISPSINGLVIAAIAMLAPTIAHYTDLSNSVEHRTNGVAVLLLSLYALLVLYRLRDLRDEQQAVTVRGMHETAGESWSVPKALLVLALAAGATCAVSEILVHHVELACTGLGLSKLFVGLFVIPLVGNVAEHFVAIQAAWQKRMDLSVGIALDSATQVALFVTPVAMFTAALFGTELTLVLPAIAIQAIVAAIVLVGIAVWDGQSNWWEGSALLILNLTFAYLAF